MRDPQFVRFRTGGKVHVFKRYRDLAAEILGESSLASALMSSQSAWCGASGSLGGLHGVSEFSDDDLCMKCRDCWPGEKEDLFRHA